MSQANNPEEPSGTFPPPAATDFNINPNNARRTSQKEALSSDASGALFSIYLKTADEEDTKMTDSWKGDAEGILVFTGLFSATVAAFIGLSYPSLQQNSQDTSAFYLAHIYQVTAAGNSSNPVLPLPLSLSDPSKFAPSSSAILVNVLWFMSLIISLTCALLATLLQQWARRYLRVTGARHSLHKQARIRAFFAEGLRKRYFPWVVEALPGLLHASVFLFFAGLPIFLFETNQKVFIAALSCVGASGLSYLLITFMPLVFYDSPYHTPLSTLFWVLHVGIRCFFLELFKLVIKFAVKFEVKFPTRRPWPTVNTVHVLSALARAQLERLRGGLVKEMKSYAHRSSWEIDARALSWAFDFVDDEHELEQILASIPGFYKSSLVKDSEKILSTTPASERISNAVLQLMDRSLSSDLVDETVRKQRSAMCLKALEILPDLQHTTIRQSLRFIGTEVFKWIELGVLADRDDSFEAKCVTALITAHTRGSDERWLSAMVHQLDLSEPIPQGDDLMLYNLLDFVLWMLFHYDIVPHLDYKAVENVSTALRKFDIAGTSPELQHQFCSMWNDILEFQEQLEPHPNVLQDSTRFDDWQRMRTKAQNLVRKLSRDMGRHLEDNFPVDFARRVVRNPTSLISLIRFLINRNATVYDALHPNRDPAIPVHPVSTDSWGEYRPAEPLYLCHHPSHGHADNPV